MARPSVLVAALLLALAGGPAGAQSGAPTRAQAAAAKACGRIVNPYEGTRYEGVDLRRIRAVGVSCRGARGVARRAHRKALGITPPPSGIRRFTWNGWSVTGDLRGSTDRSGHARRQARSLAVLRLAQRRRIASHEAKT